MLRPSTPYALPVRQQPPAELYRVLRAYYQNNGLYDALAIMLNQQGVWREALKGLRNPAFRAVEFYPAVLWPGPLDQCLRIDGATDPVKAAIEQVWQWSNWAARKQVAARQLALYGDLFIKVATSADRQRVYLQLLEPEHVTDLETDERGYVTYARVDVPQADRDAAGVIRTSLHTEVWDKRTQQYRRWETTGKSASDRLADLGQPSETQDFGAFGITFVPIVHAPFRDVGEDRGVGCFTLALDKIDEANRAATRLHQLLFRNNRAVWALQANGLDVSGRPLPPPRLTDSVGADASADTLTLEDEGIVRLPGTSSLTALVPDIKYADALQVLNAGLAELRQDLPELAYFTAIEHSDLSGRALRLMLGPALQRAAEARGNAQAALIRADQMALTLGQQAGVPGFERLGTYGEGAFAHAFAPVDVLALDPQDAADAEHLSALAVQAYVSAGMALEVAVATVNAWALDDSRLAVFTQAQLAAIQRQQQLAQADTVPAVQP